MPPSRKEEMFPFKINSVYTRFIVTVTQQIRKKHGGIILPCSVLYNRIHQAFLSAFFFLLSAKNFLIIGRLSKKTITYPNTTKIPASKSIIDITRPQP